MFNYANKAATASVWNNVSEAIFDRVIGELILGLDMAAEQHSAGRSRRPERGDRRDQRGG